MGIGFCDATTVVDLVSDMCRVSGIAACGIEERMSHLNGRN